MMAKRIAVVLALAAELGQSVCGAQQSITAAALSPMIASLMKGKRGAVVMLGVESGKIIAQWNLQVAARRVTAPGSAVKPFVLLELLQSRKIDPEQHLVCRRLLTIAGRRMDCTHSPAITDLDASGAIAYSCNTYFADAAKRLQPPELARSLERAGFNSPTALAPDEAAGRVVQATDEPHVQLQALGYWGIEVTPLELLAAYRNLALHKLKNDLPQAAPVFSGLERSVQYGMAQSAQPAGITAAGKTGTAGSTGSRSHGFFAGYAPADAPEIVLVVYLEQGHGSDAAAIAATIFSAYFSAYAKTGRGAGAAR